MTCHSQRQSPFLCRLPAEVRRLVYTEVHGSLTYRNIGHSRWLQLSERLRRGSPYSWGRGLTILPAVLVFSWLQGILAQDWRFQALDSTSAANLLSGVRSLSSANEINHS